MYDYILSVKYLAIFLLMAVFPSESIMPLAGHMASAGEVSLLGVILVGTAGSTAGSTLVYIVSWLIGPEIYEYLRSRGRWLGITPRNIDRASKWFDAHAKSTVLFGRFVPGVRTAVSVPAGIVRMPFTAFFVCTVLGSGIWIAFLAVLGYIARVEYARVQAYASDIALGVEIALLLAVVALVFKRHRK